MESAEVAIKQLMDLHDIARLVYVKGICSEETEVEDEVGKLGIETSAINGGSLWHKEDLI